MAAVLTGTPVAVTWASGANPAGQSITIPSDATAVVMCAAFWASTEPSGLSSATLNGNAPSRNGQLETGQLASGAPATMYAIWDAPATGSRTLDPAWTVSPDEGPTCIVFFVKDCDVASNWGIQLDHDRESTAVTVTLTTESGELCVAFDTREVTAPGNSSGWTSAQTHSNNSYASRLKYISAAGSSQTVNSENEAYSGLIGFAIPAGIAGGIAESVGRADETDSAQALSRSKTKNTGLSSESDSALAAGRVKARAAGLATETDVALALDYAFARGVGISTESDAALGSARSKSKATGLASETDAALALAASHSRAAGLATETDSAAALSARKSRDTGIATEADTAFALSEADGAIKAPVERANETDTALALERQKARATGLSQETDSAQALTGTHVRGVGLASELEIAFACSAIKVRPVGFGTEIDSAFQRPVAGTITLPVGLCEEFDSALELKATLRSEAAGGFWYWAERHRIERERAKRRKREIEDETRDIEEAQAREIARLLRQQEEIDAKRAELDRLQRLADRYAAESLPLAPSAAFALTAAQQKRTENALLHLQREIAQMLEEEEAMVIALLMLDDQPVAGA